MRVGFDVGPITTTRTGVGNYCFYLLKHLVAMEENCQYLGLSTGMGTIDLGSLEGRVTHRHIPLPTRFMYALWTLCHGPKVDRLLGGVDVYHATNYFLPPTAEARRVVTIHDLAFLAVPQYCSPKIVGPFSKTMEKFAKEADGILTYSEATKSDVVNFLGVDEAKITVAPMAVDEGFAPMEKEEAAARVKQKYGISSPFLLFVSTLEPRKNVVGLIRAFAKVAARIPHNLVLIGSVGWNADDIFETIRETNLEDRVIRPGFVPHMELPAFYCAADAFLFPTHYEGFGLPLLEALTCGCPVVTSSNSSIPEVTGGASIYVDPVDDDSIASGIEKVLGDVTLRRANIEKGIKHGKTFSWQDCAKITLDAYRRVVA